MFPKYKYKKGILAIGKEPDGWKDLGLISSRRTVKDGKTITECILCSVCRDRAHIGKEKGKVFRFCPRCLKKISLEDPTK